MPAFLACSTTSLFKRNVSFLLDIGRMTYVQKVFGDFGFGKEIGGGGCWLHELFPMSQ
jgi:hypothetical protein